MNKKAEESMSWWLIIVISIICFGILLLGLGWLLKTLTTS